MLRRSIEEDWPAPERRGEITDVCSSPGKLFAACFYAGYHGNPDAPVSDPSEADTAAADPFVQRLLSVQPDEDLVPTLGREFGALVASRHKARRQNFPALSPAIRQFGDGFYTQVKACVDMGGYSRSQQQIEEALMRAAQNFRCSRCYDSGLMINDPNDPPRNGGQIESKLTLCTCAAGERRAPQFGRLIQDYCWWR